MARIQITLTKQAGATPDDRNRIISDLHRFGPVEQYARMPRLLYITSARSALGPIRATPGVEAAQFEDDIKIDLVADHVYQQMQTDVTGQVPLMVHGAKKNRGRDSFFDLYRAGKQAARFNYNPPDNGHGTNYYSVDTPILPTHEQWDTRYGGTLFGAAEPPALHGTATTSVAVGNTLGVAPGANIFGCGGFFATSTPINDAINAALTHFQDNDQNGVVNMSLVSTAATDPFAAAVDACVNAGLPVVPASGNDGADLADINRWPAENEDAFTVSGLDHRMRQHPGSNRGGATDIYAMFNMYTMASHESDTAYTQPARIGGTSCSAPLVSGMILRSLSGKAKMTTRAELDTWLADFLSWYSVEDVADLDGALITGAKRLYIPDVNFDQFVPTPRAAYGIPASTPIRADYARTFAVLGPRPGTVSVDRAATYVLFEE